MTKSIIGILDDIEGAAETIDGVAEALSCRCCHEKDSMLSMLSEVAFNQAEKLQEAAEMLQKHVPSRANNTKKEATGS